MRTPVVEGHTLLMRALCGGPDRQWPGVAAALRVLGQAAQYSATIKPGSLTKRATGAMA
jgi:hypothetical protein